MTHSELHMVPSRAPSRSRLLQALLRLVVLILSWENVEEDVSKSVHTKHGQPIRQHDRAAAAVASLLCLGQLECGSYQQRTAAASICWTACLIDFYDSTASQDPHREHHNSSIDTARQS